MPDFNCMCCGEKTQLNSEFYCFCERCERTGRHFIKRTKAFLEKELQDYTKKERDALLTVIAKKL